MTDLLLGVLVCGLLVVSVYASAGDTPVTSFENDAEAQGWSGGEVVAEGAAQGRSSYRVMPGATAELATRADWSAYRHLKMDVYNPGEVIMVNFRFWDSQQRNIMAFEYNFYHGRTTQHVRIDGLANNFGIGEGIDTSHVARVQIIVSERRQLDTSTEGIYLDNLRLSNDPTEPYLELPEGELAALPLQKTPGGFLLPEFPGFEAGYNSFAIDPANYQLLALPGSGRDGEGRALEMKPLTVDSIRIWDAARTFPREGTYVMEIWAKGPAGSTFVDHSGGKSFPLTPEWKKYSYEFGMEAGGVRRFVLEVQNLQGKSAFLDDFVVYLKGGRGSLEPVSRAKGKPSVVTYADGICYINGRPTFMLGFLRSDPERLRGTPFNFCAPQELIQPNVEFLDKCAEYGLWTSVNLTATTRAIAPDSALYFAQKYKNHPAIFSYYLCDEPDHASPSATSEAPVLARATQVLHQADPNHPTQSLVIPWCASNIYRYRDVVDVLSADRYAVKGTKENTELWTVHQANEAMRRSATDGQVNVFTPLAGRGITREENWGQAYMCIAAGAGGIMWFEFGGAQAKWQDFLELGEELMSIEEFLVGVTLEKGLSFENDVLPKFARQTDFKQIRGIGRASADRTALITVNLTPNPAEDVRIIAPFLAHARQATVMFENRTVRVEDGVIVDSFEGLQRHVYVVDGVPEGVKPRPVPQVGGPHVTDAGAAWRLGATGPVKGRSQAEVERDRFIEAQVKKADELLEKGDTTGARRVFEGILERYPEAQQIRERIRVIR